MKHGMYGKVLSEAERAEWADIPTEGLAAEVKLARLQLRRALEYVAEQEAQGDLAVVEEIIETSGSTDSQDTRAGRRHVKRVRRRVDHTALIDRALNTLNRVAKNHHDMLNGPSVDGADAGERAKAISEALREIEETDGSAY